MTSFYSNRWHGVVQYMVVYELLLSVAVNLLLFVDGSRYSVIQVGPPCTSTYCAPLPLLPSCCMALRCVCQQANPLHLPLCSLCCMIPWDASQLANPLQAIGLMVVALTRLWQLIDIQISMLLGFSNACLRWAWLL